MTEPCRTWSGRVRSWTKATDRSVVRGLSLALPLIFRRDPARGSRVGSSPALAVDADGADPGRFEVREDLLRVALDDDHRALRLQPAGRRGVHLGLLQLGVLGVLAREVVVRQAELDDLGEGAADRARGLQ